MQKEVLHELRDDIVKCNLDKLSQSNPLTVLRILVIMRQPKNVLLRPLFYLQILHQIVIVMKEVDFVHESRLL